MDLNKTCPYCHFTLTAFSYFCPNCGKPINKKSLSTTVLREIVVYLISFFLPPLGFWYGFKYIRQGDEKAKRIGVIAIILTAVSLVLTIRLTIGFLNGISQFINSQTDFQNLY